MEISASYEPYPKTRASYFSIEIFRVGLEVIIVKWASERSRENVRARVPLVAKIGTWIILYQTEYSWKGVAEFASGLCVCI